MQRQNLDENGARWCKLHRNYTWIRKPQYATYCTITNIPTTIVCPYGMCNYCLRIPKN